MYIVQLWWFYTLYNIGDSVHGTIEVILYMVQLCWICILYNCGNSVHCTVVENPCIVQLWWFCTLYSCADSVHCTVVVILLCRHAVEGYRGRSCQRGDLKLETLLHGRLPHQREGHRVCDQTQGSHQRAGRVFLVVLCLSCLLIKPSRKWVCFTYLTHYDIVTHKFYVVT